MQAVRAMVFAAFLLCAALVYAAEDEGDMRIGLKPQPASPREVTTEDLQAAVKQLTAAPANNDATPWDRTPEAAALAAQAQENPELFARLLIPPGYPKAFPKADKHVRARAAAVLGLSRDLRALQPLVDSSVYDPEDSVRLAAAKALRLLDEPVALRKLVDLASARDYQKFPWPVRKSACVALRRYGDVAAIERLLRELSYELAGGNPVDPKNHLRGASVGIGTDNPMGIPTSTPDLQLSEQDLYPVLAAVKELTGVSFTKGEKDFKTWQQWWSKEGPKFRFAE